jgi:hypothetical protein
MKTREYFYLSLIGAFTGLLVWGVYRRFSEAEHGCE